MGDYWGKGSKLLTGKARNTHQTTTPETRAVIARLKADPAVTRIVLGECEALKNAPPRVRAIPIPAGLRVFVRGRTSRQTLYVYTSDPDRIQQELVA